MGGPIEPAVPKGGSPWAELVLAVARGALSEGPYSTDSGVRPAVGRVGVGGWGLNQHFVRAADKELSWRLNPGGSREGSWWGITTSSE